MPEKFDSQEYRDNLAQEIKQEPDKEKRWETLEQARSTEEYKAAKKIKLDNFIKEKKEQTTETQESAAENIFPSLFRAVKNIYPGYAFWRQRSQKAPLILSCDNKNNFYE